MNDDPLAPARGCVSGILIGGAVWVLFFVALALAVSRWA